MDVKNGTSETTREVPVAPTFRFAGVELNAGDDAEAISRRQIERTARRDLIVNTTISIAVGAALLAIEGVLAKTGLYDHPSPKAYLAIRVLIFYVGWALYWGQRETAMAVTLDEPNPLDYFFGKFLNLPAFLRVGLIQVVVFLAGHILYDLLGGGMYGFYRCIRRAARSS